MLTSIFVPISQQNLTALLKVTDMVTGMRCYRDILSLAATAYSATVKLQLGHDL